MKLEIEKSLARFIFSLYFLELPESFDGRGFELGVDYGLDFNYH